MSTPLVVFPDASLVVLGILRDRVPTYVSGVTFGTLDRDVAATGGITLPYVRVRMDAAFGSYPVTHSATVRLNVYASEPDAALSLAHVCRAVLLAFEGNVEVRGFGDLTGPIPSTDLDTEEPVAFLTVSARLRPQPLE